MIHDGNLAAVHWTDRGVNRKKEPYENEGVTILELKEGRIVFISDFFKNTEKSIKRSAIIEGNQPRLVKKKKK